MRSEINYLKATDQFYREAVDLFAPFSGSPEKIIHLAASLEDLNASAPQREMILQAARAVESQVFRGSIILSWAAVIDASQCSIFYDEQKKDAFFTCNRRSEITLDQYRERFGERDFLDVARKAELLAKNQHKELVAMLDERNACAHPSDRWPTINEATGYIDKAVRHINDFND